MPNRYQNELTDNRGKLNEVLKLDPVENIVSGWDQFKPLTAGILEKWDDVKPLIKNWWTSYKNWESEDTWKAALDEDRMSVRTFEGDFAKQQSKTVPAPDAKFNLDADRFFGDSVYTPLQGQNTETAKSLFEKQMAENFKAQKGIDSSAFAAPGNFATRDKKYQAGLHDLSASLLMHGLSIFKQVHHKTAPAFFSFVPLSMEEDQVVLYKLFRHAKGQLNHPIYSLVRGYRAEMTRVKVAQDFDMATGYTAIPINLGAERPQVAVTGIKAKGALWEKARGPVGPPTYKVRFGLGSKTTPTGHEKPDETVTKEWYQARQADALSFKRILLTQHAIEAQKELQKGGEGFKNEMVIALRKHNAGFPIYAWRRKVPLGKPDVLACFTIEGQRMKMSNITISALGEMDPLDKSTTPPRSWA